MRNSTTFSVSEGLLQLLGSQSVAELPKPLTNTQKAAWPVINKPIFAAMMTAMELRVEEINATIIAQNKLIKDENEKVKATHEAGLNEVQTAYYPLIKAQLSMFLIDLKGQKGITEPEIDQQYNAKVDQYNKDYQFIIEKRLIKTIKDSTKHIYRAILIVYQSQLNASTAYLKDSLGISIEKQLTKVRITQRELLNLSNNGAKSLHCTSKTLSNHINIMEHHGIIINRLFHGTKRPISFDINPDLMAFFDEKTQKNSCPENQYFTSFLKKNLHYINHSNTRTYINKKEIKENTSIFQNTSSLPLTTFNLNFYKNTSSKEGNFTEGAAAENVKVSEKPAPEPLLCSQVLKNTLTTQQLAENLEKGMYDNYKPLELNYLQAIYSEKSLTNAEFRDFVIQELIKYSAKIWGGKFVFPGTWVNAIKHWHENKFLTHDNNPWNQGNILNVYEQHVYRLKEAIRFFNSHPQYNPLFPSQYFDVTRTKKHEGGFGYTVKYWEKHLKNLENKPIKATKLKNQEKNRAEQCYFTRRMITIINNYHKGKASIEELTKFSTTLNTPKLKEKFNKIYQDKFKQYNC